MVFKTAENLTRILPLCYRHQFFGKSEPICLFLVLLPNFTLNCLGTGEKKEILSQLSLGSTSTEDQYMQQKAGVATNINSAFSPSVQAFNQSRMREGPKGTDPPYVVLVRKGLKDTAQPPLVVSAGLYIRAALCMRRESILQDYNYRKSFYFCQE